MKNTQLRWFGMLALILAVLGVGLQFRSAQAQYGYQAPPAQDVSTSMIERGGFPYIVQSSPYDRTLHKIREKDLVEVGRINLVPAATPRPMPIATALPQGTPTTAPVANENPAQ